MYDFNNNQFSVALTDSVFDSSIFDNDPLNKPTHKNPIKKKIFCFEFERLARFYNFEKYTYLNMRSPRVLKKYNFFGNMAILIGYKKFEYLNFRRGKLNNVVKDIAQIVDLKKSSLKAKISQLKRYVETNDENCASKGMIRMYEDYQHIEYDKLYSILSNHELHNDLEKAFTDLLCTQKSMLSINYDYSTFGENR